MFPGSAAGPHSLRPSALLSLVMFPGSPLYSVVPSLRLAASSGSDVLGGSSLLAWVNRTGEEAVAHVVRTAQPNFDVPNHDRM